MRGYVPEIGQAAFGTEWADYEVSPIGDAAIASLLDEMRRVFWNREQREIDYRSEEDAEAWNGYGTGIEWHAYWWGDDDVPEASRPHLTFDGVAVRWYKWPGRGHSCDKGMAPDDWSQWLDSSLNEARKADPLDF